MVIRLLYIVRWIFLIPLSPFLYLLYRKQKEVIDSDLLRIVGKANFFSLCKVLSSSTSFRNTLYYRIGQWQYLFHLIFPPQSNLHIFDTSNIGESFKIIHGDGTYVNATSVGKNCTVYQGVTIGVGNNNVPPVIQDNVTIYTNAIIVGDITIGENSVIAAGAVVTKNVPSNSLIAGNPAHIKRIGTEKVDIKL